MQVFVVGSLNMDLVVKASKYPVLGETVTGSSFMSNPGGKGANQAVACKRFLSDTYMVGSVGETFGDVLIEGLKKYGVKTDFIEKHQNVSSGVAMITVTEDDNVIILDMGANQLVDQRLIDRALSLAKPNDVVLLQNEISMSMVLYTLRKAKDLNLTTIYNPAPAKRFDHQFFKFVDYLILNQSETKFYSNIEPNNMIEARKACEYLKNLGALRVILTLGNKGSLYLGEDFIETKACSVDVIDTTAAGDTFIGGIVSSITKNKKIEFALEFASAAAAISITKEGAQQSIPSYEEVLNYMSKKSK